MKALKNNVFLRKRKQKTSIFLKLYSFAQLSCRSQTTEPLKITLCAMNLCKQVTGKKFLEKNLEIKTL